jgi:hypothetical protein
MALMLMQHSSSLLILQGLPYYIISLLEKLGKLSLQHLVLAAVGLLVVDSYMRSQLQQLHLFEAAC